MNTPKLEKLGIFLVLLSIFFIPFSSYQPISFLGEFSREAPVIFLIPAILILVYTSILSKKIYIPYKNPLFQLLLVILVFFLLTTLLNYPSIKDYYFKGTTGSMRFIRQFAALVASSFFFMLTYYNVFRKYSAEKLFRLIRRVFLYSFIVVWAYAFLEILIVKLNLLFLRSAVSLFDYFPFTQAKMDYRLKRISSVTFETPALATYLFTVAGWMFSYVFTEKGLKRFIPGLAVVVLALFSGSRAGLFIIVCQTLVFGIFLVRKVKYHKLVFYISIVSIVLAVTADAASGRKISTYLIEKATSFDLTDSEHAISNRSRFGIQSANFEVFKEHPILGVGYGQQSFEAKKKYPNWAKVGNWEFRLKYLNKDNPSFPPGYNIYTRLLAETGIIGTLLFLLFLVFIFIIAFRFVLKNDDRYLISIVIIIAMTGILLNWLKVDSMRNFGFWIHLALLLSMMRNSKVVINYKKDEG